MATSGRPTRELLASNPFYRSGRVISMRALSIQDASSITTFGLTDVYVFLADWNGASEATIRVFINPLTPLVWYGGAVMLLGGIVCWWPERRKRSVIKLSEMAGAVAQGERAVATAKQATKPTGRDDEEIV